MIDLELREKVAIACGWKDIRRPFPPYELTLMGKSALDDYYLEVEIPEYDLSIDAIASEFDRKKWNYNLSNLEENNKYLAVSGSNNPIEIKAETAPRALCKLFLAIYQEED